MREQLYKITNKTDSKKIAEFLSKDGQLLLPFLEMVSNTEQAVDELIDVVGKAAIEAVLMLSAQQIAGEKQPGKARNDIGWHGRQYGDWYCARGECARLQNLDCHSRDPEPGEKRLAANGRSHID